MSSQQVPVQNVPVQQAAVPRQKRAAPQHAVVEQPESSMTSMIQGIDKNLIAIVAVAAITLGVSFYLFREVKKVRDDVKSIKAQEVPDELQEAVDMNSNAINAVTTKLDQLISALSAQEQRRAQAMAQQMQQTPPQAPPSPQQMQQAPQVVAVPQQPPPVEPQTEQVQVPMMGGNVIPAGHPESAQGGPTVQLEPESDYSGPGVIKI